MRIIRSLVYILTLALGIIDAGATVILPSHIGDNMVVQQSSVITIKGKSTRSGMVSVAPCWSKKPYTANTDSEGRFSIELPTPKASLKPHTITVSDGEAVTLHNVLAGEVWLCAGQSNMEMPVAGWGKVDDYENEVKNATYPNIRLLQVTKGIAHSPIDVPSVNGGGWQVCAPLAVENFSSTAYFFARQLWYTLGIPVGVIDSSYGGSPIEAWMSLGALKHVAGCEDEAAELEAIAGDERLLLEKHERDMKRWRVEFERADAGMDGDRPCWTGDIDAPSSWYKMNVPGAMHDNGMDNYDGMVWFRKEISIPEKWVGHDLTLRLGKVDDEDMTWFNGTIVGSTAGNTLQRTYRIPASLVTGPKAVIAVRVFDKGGVGGLVGEPDSLSLSMGGETISLAGEWMFREGISLYGEHRMPQPPSSHKYMSNLYHPMVYPLRDITFKGVIWYQGESNAFRWKYYSTLFQTMIHDWHSLWKRDFPFYFVQIARWQQPQLVQPDATWAHLREAQADALAIDGTAMVSAIDMGDPVDLHPKNKQEVGRRLAQAVLAGTYHKGTYNPPAYTGSMQVTGNKAVLTFNQPLTVIGDHAEGFVIAGPDMQFHPAQATVNGNQVTVWSPEVVIPIAVRYAWANFPPNNVRSQDGILPLAPFRTDK